jgi:hypothetical protein
MNAYGPVFDMNTRIAACSYQRAHTIVDREAHDGHADITSEYLQKDLKELTCPY